jgi:hypothetical protein
MVMWGAIEVERVKVDFHELCPVSSGDSVKASSCKLIDWVIKKEN